MAYISRDTAGHFVITEHHWKDFAVGLLLAFVIGLIGQIATSNPAHADPVTPDGSPAIAQYLGKAYCNTPIQTANGPAVYSGVDFNGVAGHDYVLHIEQLDAHGVWQPLGRSHLYARVNDQLGDGEALNVPAGSLFDIFVVQDAFDGSPVGTFRLVVAQQLDSTSVLGANLDAVHSDTTGC